jgi:hypothetical protein
MEGVADALGITDQDRWADTLRARYGAVRSMREIDPAIVVSDLERSGLRKAPEKCRKILADLEAEAEAAEAARDRDVEVV